jgi:hypothetical protein
VVQQLPAPRQAQLDLALPVIKVLQCIPVVVFSPVHSIDEDKQSTVVFGFLYSIFQRQLMIYTAEKPQLYNWKF